MKIALIEDDHLQSEALAEALKDADFDVLQAYDGKAGLELVLQQRPDLILLDVLIPELSGVDFVKELQKNDWGRDVPVVLLTNLDNPQVIDEFNKLGTHDYLVKVDWKLEDVIKKVQRILNV